MRRLATIIVCSLMLGLAGPGESLAAPLDTGISVDKCKIGKKSKGCEVVSAPEIGASGGLVPIVLLGGILLLIAERRRHSQ